jgi:hypothetical protein
MSTSALGPTIYRKHLIIGCVLWTNFKVQFVSNASFNATKFCLNKFDFKFASIFDSILVLKLVEVNLMGAKGY